MPQPSSIGRRIAYWRTRRGLSQADFGSLMEQSTRWVQSLEGGQRQTDPRLSVLERAASVLGIPVEMLLRDAPAAQCVDAVELGLIRDALQQHDVLTGSAETGDVDEQPIERLRERLVYARTSFQHGKFASLGRAVPSLLADTNRAAARRSGDEQLAAFRLLSLTLELTEATAIKYGDADLALVAGHRAVVAAERSEDVVVMASAARHLADAMTAHGQPEAAAAFAIAAGERLGGELRARGADGLSVLGMLYLKAALAKAAVAETALDAVAGRAVPDLLDQADEHAAELGRDDNRMWTAFGPTNVDLYRVATHVQLCEGAVAVAIAAAIPSPALAALPRERRGHHLADLARAHTQAGDLDQAVDALLDAERDSAEEVRCRPRTQQLVRDLELLAAGKPGTERRLRLLAQRCGLPG
jgi:transcriptional regulator with XRE-family HTH domain